MNFLDLLINLSESSPTPPVRGVGGQNNFDLGFQRAYVKNKNNML
jgi:hypothetical protein